ncbi:hypothetical protein ACK2M6_00660 [Moraxella sp. TY5]
MNVQEACQLHCRSSNTPTAIMGNAKYSNEFISKTYGKTTCKPRS